MFKYFFLFLFITLSYDLRGELLKENHQSRELRETRLQSVKTHEELQNLSEIIKKLDIEIRKNEQSQMIFRKKIEDEENFANNMIFLLQENYFMNPLNLFLKTIENKNFISNKVLKKNILEIIKEDVNEYLVGLSEIETLEKQLSQTVSEKNLEKSKLKQKKSKLDLELKRISKLQLFNPQNKIFKEKAKIVKSKAKNIDELFTGVASVNKEKRKKIKKNKIKFPVNGAIISKFGETKDSFPLKDGLMFEIINEEYVISPINGVVRFAGKFMNYGNLVIIENKNFYHTIISGMDKIITNSGNRVLKGQPIAKNFFKNFSEKKKIYFELRYKGKSIDPKREVEIL